MDEPGGAAREWLEVDRFSVPEGPAGVGWIDDPDDPVQRTSHVVARDGDVWLVDPVDVPGLDEFVTELGTVAGVTVLLDRHKRDAATLARRYDVPVSLPSVMAADAADIDADTEIYRDELGATGFVAEPIVDNRFWREVVLFEEDSGTLVVPESVGTTPFFCAPGERLGVHPVTRIRPPKKLARFSPDRVLVGHGAGVHERAEDALQRALDGSRRTAPQLYWQTVRNALPV